MARVAYIDKEFRGKTRDIIIIANNICAELSVQGFTLTLRSLYYQGVARGYWPNTTQSYDRLGAILNDARLAGEMDWNYLEDRTRILRANSHWDTPADIVLGAAQQYQIDKWARQTIRPYVMVEKDAVVGYVTAVCRELDVPYFSCRGFTSVSALRDFALQLIGDYREGRTPIVFHLGDHDPSGIDMTRDITERLKLFVEYEGFDAPEVNRIALNMDQIRLYNPPPNPAKTTDSRYAGYLAQYGEDSWELDALDPNVIVALIRDNVEAVRDDELWDEAMGEQDNARAALRAISDDFDRVAEFAMTGDSNA